MEVIDLFYSVILAIVGFLLRFVYRIKFHGTSNEPDEGKLIICSNHRNNLDPILVSMAINRHIHWMGKKELFKYKPIAWIFRKVKVFPINRGEADITAIKTALRILKDDEVLGLFPEGTRVKKMDLEAVKSGAGLLAVKSKATILPVYIDSTYKIFSRVDIYIGQPLDMTDYYSRKLSSKEYEDVSRYILSHIYNLKSMEELN